MTTQTKGLSYHAGKFSANHPLAAVAIVLADVGTVYWWGTSESSETRAARQEAQAQAEQGKRNAATAAARAAQARQTCLDNAAQIRAAVATALKKPGSDAAAEAFAECRSVLDEQPEFKALVAELDRRLEAERQRAAAAYEREQRAAQRAEAARKRSQPPAIGMTYDDVVASSWGRPDKVNTDVYPHGTQYQLVYRDRGYVYIANNRVTAVQMR